MLRWCGWFCRLQAGWLRVLGDITINNLCLLFKFVSSQRSKRILCFTNQCASGWNINISRSRKREYRFNPLSVCETHFSLSGNTWLLTIDMRPAIIHRHNTRHSHNTSHCHIFVTVATLLYMNVDHRHYRRKFRKKKAYNPFTGLFSFLVSLIGRAMHRYRRGQGFESRTSLIFFFRLSLRNSERCVYNCDDLLSCNSSPHSSHIIFIY